MPTMYGCINKEEEKKKKSSTQLFGAYPSSRACFWNHANLGGDKIKAQ